MEKSPEAFRTISEVAEWLDTPAHVLRFWESRFGQIKPVKRAGGRRYYRPSDMALLAGLKQLLHVDGMTIKGAQKILAERGTAHVASLGQLKLPEGGTSAPRDRAARRARRAQATQDQAEPARHEAIGPEEAKPLPQSGHSEASPDPAPAEETAARVASEAPLPISAPTPVAPSAPEEAPEPDMANALSEAHETEDTPDAPASGAQVPAFLRRVRPSRRVLATLNAVERSRVAALYTRLENLRDRMRSGAEDRPD